MASDTVRLYYTGRGYYPGVPQRDLTEADVRRLGEARIEAITAKHPTTGRAVYQVTKPADRETEQVPRVRPGDDLNALTLPQLRALATARNVRVSSKAKKADYVAALNGETTEPADDGEPSPVDEGGDGTAGEDRQPGD